MAQRRKFQFIEKETWSNLAKCAWNFLPKDYGSKLEYHLMAPLSNTKRVCGYAYPYIILYDACRFRLFASRFRLFAWKDASRSELRSVGKYKYVQTCVLTVFQMCIQPRNTAQHSDWIDSRFLFFYFSKMKMMSILPQCLSALPSAGIRFNFHNWNGFFMEHFMAS